MSRHSGARFPTSLKYQGLTPQVEKVLAPPERVVAVHPDEAHGPHDHLRSRGASGRQPARTAARDALLGPTPWTSDHSSATSTTVAEVARGRSVGVIDKTVLGVPAAAHMTGRASRKSPVARSTSREKGLTVLSLVTGLSSSGRVGAIAKL